MFKAIETLIIWIVFIIFIGRLITLQVIRYDYLLGEIENETVESNYIEPQRGYIYDRNDKLIVANQLAYDVMITPNEIMPFDTLQMCNVLYITKEYFIEAYEKAYDFSPVKPSILISQLSKEKYAVLKEKLRQYKGFHVKKRSQRFYQRHIGANFLGYVAEVTTRDMENDSYYVLGDYIGKQGVEKQYEKRFRGKKGIKYLQKDRFNRQIGSYKEGIYDTLPIQGEDVKLTIDADLQEYAELLMQNKRGSIVAIEPKTGEILALVSSPTFDASLLVGSNRSKNYTKLYNDSIAKPLYDRGILALYPPGSTFKPLNSLIFLQEGVVDPTTVITCYRGYRYGANATMKCHCRYGSKNNLISAIYNSCNTYMASVYKKVIDKYNNPAYGIEVWRGHVESFGLGNYLGYDLPNGKKGKVPSAEYYNKVYGKGSWFSNYTISNSIGQGEVLLTPIQLSNVAVAISNRGYYYTPHIFKIGHEDARKEEFKKYTVKKYTSINKKHFEPVIEGLKQVYTKGTARGLQVKGIEIAGKTGTSENFIKINGKRMQLTDHSIFMAFAPVHNPKIAITIVVENGYWGSRFAGPMASLCIEKYLKDTITRKDLEHRMLTKSLEEEYAKPYSDKPFKINQNGY